MSLNFKTGDLAYITHPSMLGKLVKILYPVEPGDFLLPDDFHAVCYEPNGWVIESFGTPFSARIFNANGEEVRSTMFASVNGRGLRTISDDEGEDESISWAPSPKPFAPSAYEEMAV